MHLQNLKFRNKLKIYNDIEILKLKNPIVSIGIFDGVHVGHKKIINRLNELASEYNGESVIVTLWPHPRGVLQKENNNSHYLTTLEEKEYLLDKLGVDNLIILPFTRQLSEKTFSDFTKHYLINKIKAKHIVIGYNHHFGKDREGDFQYLKGISKEYGFNVEQLSPVIVNDSYVSSSAVRQNIENGRIETANKLLGYAYFIQGKIVAGRKIGRKMGFPTANINLSDSNKLLPGNGVYAVKVFIDSDEYKGMLNIGTRPTIKEKCAVETIEVHIIDFSKEIYKKEVIIHFIERLREEKKFGSEKELIDQLNFDKYKVMRLLSK